MTDDDESPTRRARLDESRRRRRRVVAAGVAALVVVAGVSTAVVINAAGTDDGASATPSEQQPTDNSTPVDLPELENIENEPPRDLSHDDPLRLWIGGDSLAGALGPALGEAASQTGVVETTVDYRVSSGLAKNGVRNWPEQAAADMEEQDPEAAVFFIGANDASIVNSHDGDDDGTPDWDPDYREKVGAVMDTLVGGDKHRTVLWLGAPTMRDEDLDDGVAALNEVMREEADKRGPDVVYVDTYRLFGDENGEFTMSVPTDRGDVRVRVYDGVHLTPAGAEYLAEAVFTLLDARWAIIEHSEKGEPIEWSYAESSGSGEGYSPDEDESWQQDEDWEEPEPVETTTSAPVATTTVPPATTTTPTTIADPTTSTTVVAPTTTAG